MSGGSSSGWRALRRARHSARSRSTPSSRCRALSIAFTAPPSRQLGCSCSVWPGAPGHRRPSSRPSRGTQARPPGCCGSGTIAKSAATPWRAQARPPTPLDSSSVFVHTIRSPARPPAAATASAATTIAAIPPFMSHAPRPTTRPSRTCGVERIVLPAVLAPRRDDVDVAVEQQRPAAARAAEARRELRPPREADPARGRERMAGDVLGRRLPHVDLGAGGAAAARPGAAAARPRRGPGAAGSARLVVSNRDQVAEQRHQLVRAGGDGVDEPLLVRVECRGHRGSMTRGRPQAR